MSSEGRKDDETERERTAARILAALIMLVMRLGDFEAPCDSPVHGGAR